VAGIGLLGVAGAMSGCADALLSRPDPPDLYTLTPKSTFPDNLPTVDWQLLVEEPEASAGLDTNRIAVLEGFTRLQYFAGVAWTDRAPLMVQTLLIESFSNSDRIVSVGREGFGLRADYTLQLELREFQAEAQASGPPHAHAAMTARLVKLPERVIIANQSFDASNPAVSENFNDIILAFDEALGDVMRDIVAWTLQTGQADAASVS